MFQVRVLLSAFSGKSFVVGSVLVLAVRWMGLDCHPRGTPAGRKSVYEAPRKGTRAAREALEDFDILYRCFWGIRDRPFEAVSA